MGWSLGLFGGEEALVLFVSCNAENLCMCAESFTSGVPLSGPHQPRCLCCENSRLPTFASCLTPRPAGVQSR